MNKRSRSNNRNYRNKKDNTLELTDASIVSNDKPQIFTRKCPVIGYIARTRTLQFRFGKYGLSVIGVDKPTTDEITIEYSGQIGTPDFNYRYVQ